MSDEEGAARAQAGPDRQPTPLFDTTSARNRKLTPPRGLGAHTIRALFLPTLAMDHGDHRTEHRRLDSASEER